MYKRYHDFLIRDWTPADRDRAAQIIGEVLAEFHLDWEPQGADRDVMEIEASYLQTGGQFWVIESPTKLVGTAAFYPLPNRQNWAEIRKMYLLPIARRQGLGCFLLNELETQIQSQNFEAILIETSTKLEAAIKLYEGRHYSPFEDVETERCDRAYIKYISA
jgi:putative acetyltransferase